MAYQGAPSAPAFPASALDVKAELRLSDGTWQDVSQYVVQDSPVSIERGHPDESTTVSPGQTTLTLFNGDGRFTDSNPSGPYWGKFGRNSQLRVSTPDGITSYQTRDEASYVQCSAATPTSTFDFQMDVAPDNWHANNLFAGQWTSDTNASWALMGLTTRALSLFYTHDGSTRLQANSATLPEVSGKQRLSIRFVFNYTTAQVQFYYSTTPGLDAAQWISLGSATASTGIFVNGSPLQLGDIPGSTFLHSQNFPYTQIFNQAAFLGTPIIGQIYAARLYNGIGTSGGTAIAEADFTAQTPGATSFTDPESNTWALHGTGAISDRKYRFTGEVAAWPQAWGPVGNDAKASITAAGLLRRITRTQNPTQSPMYRAQTRATGITAPIAYWPMEDGENATQIASGLPAGAPMAIGPTNSPMFAQNNDFASSSPLPALNGAKLKGTVPAASTTSANLSFLLSPPSAGEGSGTAPGSELARINLSGGSVFQVSLYMTSTAALTAIAYGYSGTTVTALATTGSATNGNIPQFVSFQWDGANLVWQSFPIDNTGLSGFETVALSGTLGSVASIQLNPAGTFINTAIGHVTVQPSDVSNGQYYGPATAWIGEYSSRRFGRLCREEGIPVSLRGAFNDSAIMGAQSIETISELLQECADTDGGMWYEQRGIAGFGYQTRTSLGSKPKAVVFDYAQDQLSGDLSPTKDDQTTVNDITATQTVDGSSARQVQAAGPMGTGTIGTYDTEISVNLAKDSDLQSVAGFQLLKGTVPDARYPNVECDLGNAALTSSFYYAVQDLDVGDRFTIINPPPWIPEAIDQLANQYSESLFIHSNVVTLVGVPATPYDSAWLDISPDLRTSPTRVDTDGSTLAFPLTGNMAANSYFSKVIGDQGFLQGDLTNWTPFNGTIQLDAGTVFAGGPFPYSGIYTATSTSEGNISSVTAPFPVSVGGTYSCSAAAVYSPVPALVRVGFDFLGSGGTYLSTTVASVNIAAGSWSPVGSGAVTAPAGAVSAYPRVGFSGGTAGQQLAVQGVVAWGSAEAATTPSGAKWVTGSAGTTVADYPIPVTIAPVGGMRGENAYITAASTASTQVLTLVRGANGVCPPHAAGDDIRVNPTPYVTL